MWSFLCPKWRDIRKRVRIRPLRPTRRSRTHMFPQNRQLNYIMQSPHCLPLINFSALHVPDTRLCLREKSAFVGWSRLKMTDAIPTHHCNWTHCWLYLQLNRTILREFTTHFRFHYISADKSQANLRVTALNMAKSELGNGGELLNFLWSRNRESSWFGTFLTTSKCHFLCTVTVGSSVSMLSVL